MESISLGETEGFGEQEESTDGKKDCVNFERFHQMISHRNGSASQLLIRTKHSRGEGFRPMVILALSASVKAANRP